MDPEEPRSLNWKTCFKKILAPHLLNPTDMEEQIDAPHSLNASNGEEQKDTCYNILNPKNDSVNTSAFLNDTEKAEDAQKNITSSITAKADHINDRSQSFIDTFCHFRGSDSSNRKLNDAKNPVETEENIEKIIAADAEELAKNFKKLKFKKKHINMAQNSRNAPEWKHAFKKVLDPTYAPEGSVKTQTSLTSEEVRREAMKRIKIIKAGGPIDTEFFSAHPELYDSLETNPWTYFRLTRDYNPLENKESENSDDELTGQQSKAEKKAENVKRKKPLSKEEKRVLEVLRLAKTFNPPKKVPLNIFDGAGVNCFKDSDMKATKNTSSSPEKPKNVPPPGGWVCVKPFSINDPRNEPINIMGSECWDFCDDEW